MSARINWRPIAPSNKYFDLVGSEREYFMQLFKIDTAEVITLREGSIPKLQGLAIVYPKVNHIIDAIIEHDEIEVWVTY